MQQAISAAIPEAQIEIGKDTMDMHIRMPQGTGVHLLFTWVGSWESGERAEGTVIKMIYSNLCYFTCNLSYLSPHLWDCFCCFCFIFIFLFVCFCLFLLFVLSIVFLFLMHFQSLTCTQSLKSTLHRPQPLLLHHPRHQQIRPSHHLLTPTTPHQNPLRRRQLAVHGL
jgi:hypothetical protein